MTEDGVTASGYGAENAWEVRADRYSPDGDEVIPSNAKNASLARHVQTILTKFRAKIEIWSAHNLLCQKFAAVCRKIVTSCPAYFINPQCHWTEPLLIDGERIFNVFTV